MRISDWSSDVCSSDLPFARKRADRQDVIVLDGDMAAYVWTLDGLVWRQHRPIAVRAGDRVEVTLRNQSMMGHPMHLHGHHFQVVAIDGRRFAGARRDTVWLPPQRELTIAFDADNPGTWAFQDRKSTRLNSSTYCASRMP